MDGETPDFFCRLSNRYMGAKSDLEMAGVTYKNIHLLLQLNCTLPLSSFSQTAAVLRAKSHSIHTKPSLF